MEQLPVLDFATTMAGLPHSPSPEGLDDALKEARNQFDFIIVLDDDPTGTQTVYGVPVITRITDIASEIAKETPLFYVLTNSRALTREDAASLSGRIGQLLRDAAAGKRYLVIFRGDSTLRGHYPFEEEGYTVAAGKSTAPHWLIPAFFEGGRYTIDDVHYVREGERLVPAAQTPFARDSSFGYANSDLKEWVKEKGNSNRTRKIYAASSVSLDELRNDDLGALEARVRKGIEPNVIVVNAVDYTDLKRAALVIMRGGEIPVIRSSASFIKALLAQPDRPLLKFARKGERGGLIVVGSHVPKTTTQLAHLRAHTQLTEYELDVRALLFTETTPAPRDRAQEISAAIARGEDVLLFTSREVITTDGADANLDIAAKVSAYLETVVAELSVQPSFLVTKGGITSSRIATESLGVKRAMALGQVQPGVPTWELGPESKFPGMPFVIFPGNVGGEDALTSIMQNTIS